MSLEASVTRLRGVRMEDDDVCSELATREEGAEEKEKQRKTGEEPYPAGRFFCSGGGRFKAPAARSRPHSPARLTASSLQHRLRQRTSHRLGYCYGALASTHPGAPIRRPEPPDVPSRAACCPNPMHGKLSSLPAQRYIQMEYMYSVGRTQAR